ncbi:MAG: chemotaxis protein CheX [Pirellulaceae bacterium]
MVQSATGQIESDIREHFVSSDQVVSMMQTLFESLLGEALKHTESAPPATESWIRSKIEITGEEHCFVQVSADPKMAYRIASTMFETPEDEIDPSEVGDALCEVVNVIGGNIKGAIDRSCDLSLPTVDDGEPVVNENSIVCDLENDNSFLKVIVI